MNKWLAAFLFFVLSSSANAFQPRTGTWWNPNESGTAYEIEIQDGVLVITVYSYQAGGAPQWYLAAGPMTNNRTKFTGTLDKYVGGPCISCPYAGRPTLVGNDGTVTVAFASEMSATVTLSGGRTTQIQPFNFAIGEPPTGLLGEWVFTYDIGASTIAQRFTLTSLQPASSGGNGIVVDASRLAFCELQTSGNLAGIVLCGQVDANGGLLSLYAFRFGLDKTYEGLALSPPDVSGTLYPMKGFKVKSKGEVASNVTVVRSKTSVRDGKRGAQAAGGAAGYPDAAIEASFEALVDAISRAIGQQVQ